MQNKYAVVLLDGVFTYEDIWFDDIRIGSDACMALPYYLNDYLKTNGKITVDDLCSFLRIHSSDVQKNEYSGRVILYDPDFRFRTSYCGISDSENYAVFRLSYDRM